MKRVIRIKDFRLFRADMVHLSGEKKNEKKKKCKWKWEEGGDLLLEALDRYPDWEFLRSACSIRAEVKVASSKQSDVAIFVWKPLTKLSSPSLSWIKIWNPPNARLATRGSFWIISSNPFYSIILQWCDFREELLHNARGSEWEKNINTKIQFSATDKIISCVMYFYVSFTFFSLERPNNKSFPNKNTCAIRGVLFCLACVWWGREGKGSVTKKR